MNEQVHLLSLRGDRQSPITADTGPSEGDRDKREVMNPLSLCLICKLGNDYSSSREHCRED